MNFLSTTYSRIMSLEKKLFYRGVITFFGTIILLIGAMLAYYYTTVYSLKSQLVKTKRQQEEIRLLLGQFTQLQEESKKVNDVLEEEKNFKIKSFYESILQQQNLQNSQLKEAEIQEENLRSRYIEIKLTSHLQQLSTEQLCTLLETLEKKARIYIKDLSIVKIRNNNLDVVLVIGTLKIQSETK
jgi:hypothetical protein